MKAGSRWSGSRQGNKEEKEGGKIKVTPVSVTEELGRRESKAVRAKLKDYEEIWAIRKRWRCEPKLRAGSGVKRGEEVRVGPAALLRTGYPVRKAHLSLSLSLSFCLLNSHSGHSGEERCNLSLKTPEKTQVPGRDASLSSIIGDTDG